MKSRKLRLESLEDRTLLAVTSGGTKLAVDLAVQNQPELIAVPEIETSASTASAISFSALPAVTGDATEEAQYNTACDIVAIATSEINNYFSSPTYSKTVTKDYVVYFAGGINANRNDYATYLNMVYFYHTITTQLNIAPENIYILYADGTNRGIDRTRGSERIFKENSDMTFATSHGTNVYAATRVNLYSVMDTISVQMDAESHLLFFAYDHGEGAPGNANDYNDYICAWGGSSQRISGTDIADQMFKIKEGYVTCVFTECFSGGILDDIFTVSTGRLNSQYTGNAHFYGAAAANHYESASFRKGIDCSFALFFIDSLKRKEAEKPNLNTKSCFEYARQNEPYSVRKTNDPYSENKIYKNLFENYDKNEGIFYTKYENSNEQDYVEHPWDIGESFDIFGYAPMSKAPDLSVTGGTFTTPSNGKFTLTTGTIQNVGTVTASGSYLLEVGTFDPDTGEVLVLKTQTVTKTIAPGKSATFRISNIPTSDLKPGGTYYVVWAISEVAGESNLNNNIAVCSAMLTAPGPDLTASVGGTAALSGNTISLTTGTVRNAGKGAANAGYKITFYASTDTTITENDIQLGDGFTINEPLAAGKSKTFKFNVSTDGLAIGQSYYIGWIISDVDGESVKTNNAAYCRKPLTIPGPPDIALLASASGTIKFNSKNNTFSLSNVKFQNIGTGAASSYTFTISAVDINKNEYILKTAQYNRMLGVGKTVSVSMNNVSINTLPRGKDYVIGWYVLANGDTNFDNGGAICRSGLKIDNYGNASLFPLQLASAATDTIFEEYKSFDPLLDFDVF